MNQQQEQVVQVWVEQLGRGAFTETQLRRAFEEFVANDGPRQDLLYLQASESALPRSRRHSDRTEGGGPISRNRHRCLVG